MSDLENLRQAIVYMKMDELRAACRILGISASGQKRELIVAIMATVEFGSVTGEATKQVRRSGEKQEYRMDALLRPETYTNGAASRAFLTSKIGKHFRFTTFGMDWIKAQWASGRSPSFADFIEFWKREYTDRQAGKEFTSKPELARVNFFRRVSRVQRTTKAELEQLWLKEREARVNECKAILDRYLRTKH